MRVTVLTDRAMAAAAGHRLPDVVAAACSGGATLVLMREKDVAPADRSTLAATLRRMTRDAGVAFGLAADGADDVALARAVGADLTHLAASAPWPTLDDEARDGMLLGRSCHTPDDVAGAAAHGADLVTYSPVYRTSSKPGYGPAVGPEGLAAAVAAALAGPGAGPRVLALGGIAPGNAAACLAAGATGVCVMGAVMRAADPGAVVRAVADELAGAAAGVPEGVPAHGR